MKKLLTLGLLASLTVSASVEDKVIYGVDDRNDVYAETNSLYVDLAVSTAAMIPANKVQLSSSSNVVTFRSGSLSSRGICETERFSNQATAANCSGFLVAPDLLVTAGHCIRSQSDCEANKWVFGYAHHNSNTDAEITVTKKDVYGCKEIVEQKLAGDDDYALLRLERKVSNRAPLTFRKSGKVKNNTPLVVIGHPSGLPTKIADGANVRAASNNNPVFFQSNLDTFGGNSGSAVFNAETGVVEGILVRGETDYEYDWGQGCRVVKECTNGGCRGEDVTRITNIKALKNL